MAIKYWEGTADAVAQQVDVTVGGTLAGETFTISVGGVAIASHTDADTVIATTVAALVVAWNNSTHPYATGITATDSSPDVDLVADTAGVEFAVTLNTPGGAATLGQTATTANAGPNDWSTATNWSTGAVPVNADDVIIKDGSSNIFWGLDQSAVALTSLRIDKSYSGKIGLRSDAFTTAGNGEAFVTTKTEYRGTYLQIGSVAVSLGENFGPVNASGSTRIKIDLGAATASQVIVYETAQSSSESGLTAVRFLAANAGTDITVKRAIGGVGIAIDKADETSTVGDIICSDVGTNSRVWTSIGVTSSLWYQTGGTNVMQAAATVASVRNDGGTLDLEGDWDITLLETTAGTTNVSMTNAVPVVTLDARGGTIDFNQLQFTRTVTNLNLEKGATIRGNDEFLTFTNVDLTHDEGVYTLSKR